MPDSHDILFRALADPTRRAIFERLCREGEQTVGSLTVRSGVSQPAVSKHLGVLKQADPEVVEEWKWRGVPVWSHAGIICTGETYRNVVKMTFARGASLEDPSGLFNSSLEGNTRRAIDFHEGDKIDERALKALIRAAVALNTSARAAARPARSQKRPKNT